MVPELHSPSPWHLATLLAVVERLRALDPTIALIDGSYPFQRLSFVEPGHAWLLPAPTRARPLPPFFETFHPNRSDSAGLDLPRIVAALEKQRRTPWLALGRDQALQHPRLVMAMDVPLLLFGDGPLPRLDGLAEYRFVLESGAPTEYVALLPKSAQARLAVADGPLSCKTVAVPRTIRLAAGDVVSDGAWSAEGPREAEWMWTGPAVCHRVCLGHLPDEARAIALSLLDTPMHQALRDNLVVQVNGPSVPLDLSQLERQGGRVRFDLPPGLAAPAVLGLCAFPRSVPPSDASARHLRMAYAAVEVLT